jgi:hypothetical protein
MPTERINHRFVDPGSWVTDGALERENSPVIAFSQIGHRAFPANGMPVAFMLSAHCDDRYDVPAAARELSAGQAMASNL